MHYTKADIKQQDGKIYGVASSSVEDRQGEVVDVDGWDLKNFKKSPRLLWAHDHYEPAIGKVSKTWYEGTGKKRQLMFEAVFQEVTERARAIKQLVQDGFINTFSVGFKPLEMDGNRITKQELLEISVVNVPANPEAMMLAYKTLKDAGISAQGMEEVNVPAAIIERLEEMDEKVNKAVETAELAVKGLQYLAPQRSKHGVATKRLELSKVIVKAADKLIVSKQAVPTAKIIKRSSEMLIREHKEDLNGITQGTTKKAS